MRAEHLWIAGVVGVLVLTVAGNFWVLRVANTPNGMAMEKDYYHKAVQWDSTMAQGRRNEGLGWKAEADMGALDAAGEALLTVRLVDRAGRPVRGAAVHVQAIHNLQADRPTSGTLASAADGAYSAKLPLGRPGRWEVRVDAERGAERYTADLHCELGAGSR